MNVTSYSPAIAIPTVANPATDALRRDNHQREMIAQPAAVQQSAAEKGVASDRDKARSPAQNNDQVDFENLRKQAELANSRIASDEEGGSPHDSQGQNQNQDEQAAQDKVAAASADGSSEQDDNASQEQKAERAKEVAEQNLINDLKQRDKEVKAHEAAHASVGGSTTGAPSYTFQTGPDGKKYAVSGEVSVDLSPIAGNPQATITKLQKVYNAALAPAHPSVQDTRVASSAAKLILQAQSEILSLQLEDPNKVLMSGQRFNESDIFSEKFGSNNDENDFDRHIKHTLAAQERVAPTRSNEIDQRAVRIESFYSNINHAYEKPASYQFELTA